ncbi:hypothetical protein CERZMDRAFT_102201 [Cercospora zeae-maydis SCOH1-5]|uniref:amidase n=1 Tax=Cercospora zeae-maydis SCOH1-5 TaxID=717836 RepID=A0A6A6F330_9PEZI|nr:hypothetical protein CERZMDRAFT_102201 [Cercospora zeae-maydis SCOH1-5]
MAASESLPVIITVPVPSGSKDFEQKRAAILEDFGKKVPAEYRIASHYIDNPPRDVTSIPRECGVLDQIDLEITENYDVTGLAEAIAAKKYTAVQAATAFIKRSIVAHQLSCCLTQWLPDEALKQAKELDEHLAREGKTVGPLHGVPISIKQHFPQSGTWSDLGFLATRQYDETDCNLVAILRSLGAVFYCKTNQPQGIMHIEADGYLGRTLNPYNIQLSSGGSSGGESALIALRGSIMGVGSDIGGSIRVPSGFTGIWGFKPTANTLPGRDMLHHGSPAELNILATAGPMCHSLRDVDLFMRELLARKPYILEPQIVPIPWTGLTTATDISTSKPLKVGIMMDDRFIQPQPPVINALRGAERCLESSPLFQVKPFKAYRTEETYSKILPIYYPDGAKSVHDILRSSGEPVHVLTPPAGFIEPVNDSEGIAKFRRWRDDFRAAASQDWAAQDVDVVLCPMHVGPASAHDTGAHLSYTAMWNVLDCPAIVFPSGVRAGKKGTEHYADDGKAWNPSDANVRELWEKHDYEGAPIALQLVARRHHDNFLIAAVGLMKEALQLE